MIIEENRNSARPLPLMILRCWIADEHPDNDRFSADCERWFGVPITTIRDQAHNAEVDTLFRKKRYMNGLKGAICTRVFKRELAAPYMLPGDLNVYGYDADEPERLDAWIDANNEKHIRAPLIERQLSKNDCLALVDKAGIKLPFMYSLGYPHNNCIGCVKAGAWYWNRMRIEFPLVFQRRMETEELIGHPMLRINNKSVWLRELDPARGRKWEEPKIECGVACELMSKL